MFDVVLPIENVHAAVVLDFHYNQSKLFYADVNVDVIKSVDMNDMKNTKNIVSTGLRTPSGLAVDWLVSNELYFLVENNLQLIFQISGWLIICIGQIQNRN